MSGIATGTALAIGAGVSAAGGIASAAMESNAAGNAADTQAQAADYAANLQAQMGQESLANEVQTQQQNQANEQPWLQTGANSLATLAYLLGVNPSGTVGGGGTAPGQTLSIPGVSGSVTIPGVTGLTGTANTNIGRMGSLMEAYPGGEFSAPTIEQAQQEPGYKFALQQGENVVQAGAAANGSLLTGGTQAALNEFGQNYANTNYQNIYNRALQTYNTNYNTWANNRANQFNMLAALSGAGQTTAQTLGNQNLTSAGQVANTLNTTGAQIGAGLNNAAAATASGYIGSANAWGGALTGATSGINQLAIMNSILNGGGGGGTPTGPYTVPNLLNNPSQIANPYSGVGATPGYVNPYAISYAG